MNKKNLFNELGGQSVESTEVDHESLMDEQQALVERDRELQRIAQAVRDGGV